MTTRVLRTTLMQKRRAQWSLQPKTPAKSDDGGMAADEPDGEGTVATTSAPSAAGLSAAEAHRSD